MQTALAEISDCDEHLKKINENCDGLAIQIKDISDDIKNYLDKIEIDPARLQFLEERMSALFSIARKYKIQPDELFSYAENLRAQLTQNESHTELLNSLRDELIELEKKYFTSAENLSKSRKKYAKQLSSEILTTIQHLAMPNALFEVHLEEDSKQTFTAYGFEKVSFIATMNPGQSLQPISKIASGGELSRISLAIHVATANQHTTPCLIFDEVDTGISGATAEIVGQLINQLGQSRQVICITHLPQVAAQGNTHLLVEKTHHEGSTTTCVRELTKDKKIKELARLLGGVTITKKTLDHAKEMLEKM